MARQIGLERVRQRLRRRPTRARADMHQVERRSSASDPAHLKRNRREPRVGRGAGAGAHVQANLRAITSSPTRSQGQGDSDRWRGLPTSPTRGISGNRVEREVVEALVAAVARPYPRLSHRYYALKANVRQEALAHWAAMRRCRRFRRA